MFCLSGSAVSQAERPSPVSGLCTRVPGTVRVWSAVADTPQTRLCRVRRGRDSQETAAQKSVFLPAG